MLREEENDRVERERGEIDKKGGEMCEESEEKLSVFGKDGRISHRCWQKQDGETRQWQRRKTERGGKGRETRRKKGMSEIADARRKRDGDSLEITHHCLAHSHCCLFVLSPQVRCVIATQTLTLHCRRQQRTRHLLRFHSHSHIPSLAPLCSLFPT